MAVSGGLNKQHLRDLLLHKAEIQACCGYEIWEDWRILLMRMELVLEMVIYVDHLVWPSTQENVIVSV